MKPPPQPIASRFKAIARRHLPRTYAACSHAAGWAMRLVGWASRLTRRVSRHALFSVGLIASLYAVGLFITDRLTPDAPKPKHDRILKARFSSPMPSKGIVIVDVDERSLATLASAHGRWPWSRDVLADGLQKIADAGAKAVLFNVMLSDPDKGNPDGDAAMELTAQMVRPAAFPMIRLSPSNDSLSKLEVSSLPGAQVRSGTAPPPTIAAVLPMFETMRDRIGIANQAPDADGVVRSFRFRWTDPRYSLPSIVEQVAALGGADVRDVPDRFALNWRNKLGRYSRLSFSDILQMPDDDPRWQGLKDAYVVLGASAPGVGQTKVTSVSALEDDNEILATAIDDAIHKTWLRMPPAWMALVFNLLTIVLMVWLSLSESKSQKLINISFVALQTVLGAVTILSASYTVYLVDLSDSMSLSLGIFGAIKLFQSLENTWSRAIPGIRRVPPAPATPAGRVLLLGWFEADLGVANARLLQSQIEEHIGLDGVIRLDDLFSGKNFLKPLCERYRCLLAHGDPERLESLLAKIEPFLKVVQVFKHDLSNEWNPNDPAFTQEAASFMLASIAAHIGTRDAPKA